MYICEILKLMLMSLFLIGTLIILGFVLLILELLVLPGTTVVGILGLGAIGYAIYESFVAYGPIAGTITIALSLVLGVLLLVYALRSKTWQKLKLTAEIRGKSKEDIGQKVQVGDKGICISRLAPMGNVDFQGDYYEAQSLLNFVDQGKEVVIIKIDGNKIYVKEINS